MGMNQDNIDFGYTTGLLALFIYKSCKIEDNVTNNFNIQQKPLAN